MILDGASYHRSSEFKAYLDTINQGLNENEYKVTCLRFAPNDPTQNPVEDIWLHAKNFIREFYHFVKRLFELVTHHQVFDFPKIFMYGSFFSQLIYFFHNLFRIAIPDPNQQLNISDDASVESSQIGGLAGRDMTVAQNQGPGNIIQGNTFNIVFEQKDVGRRELTPQEYQNRQILWECVQVVPSISGPIVLSPNQDILATLGGTVIHLFKVNTGQLIRTLTGDYFDSQVSGSFAFSPDGQTLASIVIGPDDTYRIIKLWEIQTGKEIRTLTDPSKFTSVAFSPDGRILASGSWDETIKLWEVETGRELRTLTSHSKFVLYSKFVNFLAFSPDGQTLASGNYDDETIKLWEVETGRELRTFTGHSYEVYSVTFSWGGRILGSASKDGTIKLWEVETGRELRTIKNIYDVRVYSVALSPDGRTLASGCVGDANTIRLWEVETGRELRTITNLPSNVKFLAFSRNGRTLISGCDDGTITWWSVQTGWLQKVKVKEIGELSRLSSLASVAFSPDGQTVVSNYSGTKLLQVPTDGQQKIIVGQIRPPFGVANSPGALSPDGGTVAIGIYDYIQVCYKLYSVQTGKEIWTLPPGHRRHATFATFRPDGQVFASGSDYGTIKLWDVKTGREICTVTKFSGRVTFIALSPDKRTLAFGVSNSKTININELWVEPGSETIKLWDLETVREICTLTGHSELVDCVVFSPDGRTIASGSRDQTIKLWEVETGREICTLTGHSTWVYSIAFSPDGRTIASGSWGRIIKLWDVLTGKEICTLGHSGPVKSITFSLDGRTLAAGDRYGNIKIWRRREGTDFSNLA